MTRTELINILMLSNNLKHYLEIGMQKADNNFNKIIAPIKMSVDPDPKAKAWFVGTSDDFFVQQKKAMVLEPFASPFDLIFIDGLHESEQVERDIINSMSVLSPNGFIVLHDCNPPSEKDQLVPRQHKIWYGDVWRAFVGFRLKYPYEIAFCIDHDCGLGVIKYTDKKIEPGFSTNMSWQRFENDRKQLLGII